jgi:hypothetical protein
MQRMLSVILVVTIHAGLAVPLFGQTESQDAPATSAEASQSTKATSSEPHPASPSKKKKKKSEPRGAFAAAPIPISNPALGSGLVPVVAYIFPFSKKDKISPPSVIGAGGLITNNSSRGFAVGGQFFVKKNTYQITSIYVRGNLDYNIYGTAGTITDAKLPLEQTGQAYLGEFLRRVGWKVFVGPRFIAGDSLITIQPNSVAGFPIPPDTGIHTKLVAIGARVTRDTSVNRFYPVTGSFFTFTSDFFSQNLGSKYSFQSYKTSFSKYWSLNKKQVLAYNGYFCAVGGAPPFYGNCIYGTNSQLRGYTAGKYFDQYMMATQAEYRLVLPWRLGLVAFGGIGGVRTDNNQLFQSSHFLPAGGGGLRFDLSPKYHVNLRADIARGVDGHTFSLGILEAF